MANKNLSLRLVQDKTVEEPQLKYVGNLWSNDQRLMHSLHYLISYRDSFKPELPEFCIERYSSKGQVVLDPFCGRGTTALQSNLMGRVAWAADINPLAVNITRTKTMPVGLDEIVMRLNEIDLRRPIDLTNYAECFEAFFHLDTYRELANLRSALRKNPDRVNSFIQLLTASRLHGHSAGFFSAYSLPQIALSPDQQWVMNLRRRELPDYRAVAPRIIKKAAHSLRDPFPSELFTVSTANDIRIGDARKLDWIKSDTVDLIVTAPPTPVPVNYLEELWLECWFMGIAQQPVLEYPVQENHNLWNELLELSLKEMLRVVRPRGYVVIDIDQNSFQLNSKTLDEFVIDKVKSITFQGKRFVVEELLINQNKLGKLASKIPLGERKGENQANKLIVMRCVAKKKVR